MTDAVPDGTLVDYTGLMERKHGRYKVETHFSTTMPELSSDGWLYTLVSLHEPDDRKWVYGVARQSFKTLGKKK